jgi:xylose isomerase
MEGFFSIGKIQYEGPASKNPLAFKYYNADEIIHGKSMKEWLRFSICYWHTFRGTGMDPFGSATLHRAWDDGSDSLDNAKRRLCAAFEFFSKIGAPYWTFHDRDISPPGKSLEETNRNLDEIAALAKSLQEETGIKLLWGTANLFSHPMFMCGASSNPEVTAYAYAAAQVKKAIEITKFLGGENFVFWNGRDGYQTLLNTDMKRELSHVAEFYKMAIRHCEAIGFKGQLLIEPKPREPMKHQYDYDAQTVISFLEINGLAKHFKVNIEPNHTTLAGHCHEHDIIIASKLGFLGSIDCNTGDEVLGWDTDQFPGNPYQTTAVMRAVLEQGGLAPGGLNFDCKVRRESTDVEDMFISHIGGMDTYARGLRAAANILADDSPQSLTSLLKARYASWDGEWGKKVESGKCELSDLEELVKRMELKGSKFVPASGKQELFERVYGGYVL